MGVSLGDFVVKEQRDINKLPGSGHSAAVDLYGWFHQFLHKIRGQDNKVFEDDEGRTTSHLMGMMNRSASLIDAGVRPVFVLEGDAPDIKSDELERRREKREENKEKIALAKEANRDDIVKKLRPKLSRVSDQMVEDARRFVVAMGCPIVTPPSEGEIQAAMFVREGICDYCITQDYDALMVGSPNILQNLTSNQADYISLETSLNRYDLTHEELVWIGIMLGTDFNESPDGVGPKTAEGIARRVSSFDEVIVELKEEGYEVKDWEFYRAYEWFAEPDYEEADICWGEPNREEMKRVLCDRHGFSEDYVEGPINRIVEGWDAPQQSAMDEFL